LARESLLLSIALQQEEELRLERVGASILVEPPQKRIVVDLLEDQWNGELGGETTREDRLPDADRALDRYVPPPSPAGPHPRSLSSLVSNIRRRAVSMPAAAV